MGDSRHPKRIWVGEREKGMAEAIEAGGDF
jgi:hypothetical protein